MSELSRIVALDRVGAVGLDYVVEAAGPECAALAERLRIVAVERVRCAFSLRRVTGSVIEAEGVLEAAVVQNCVVSLEPIGQVIDERFAVQFVPLGSEAPDDDFESPDQIVYQGSAIDLGEATAEQLALALDPYPRAPGLEDPAEAPEDTPHPFAGLAALHGKS